MKSAQPVIDLLQRSVQDRKRLVLAAAILLGLGGLVLAWNRLRKWQRQRNTLSGEIKVPAKKQPDREVTPANAVNPLPTSEAREPAYFSLRNVLIAAGVLVGMVAFIQIFAAGLLTFAPPRSASTPELPPEPRLQVSMDQDLQILQATQQSAIHSYGWVDRKSGAVHIPVDQAMKLLLDEGFPTLPQGNQTATPSGPVEADDSGFPHPTFVPSTPPGPDTTTVLTPSLEITPTALPSGAMMYPNHEPATGQGSSAIIQVAFSDPRVSGFQRNPNTGDTPPSPVDLQEVRYDQKTGSQLPLDTLLTDEDGNQVKMGDYFGSKPVVLIFAYYDCPRLCSVALNDLAEALRGLELTPGNQFNLLTVSFKPGETPRQAAEKKATYMQIYNRPKAAEGWHFLTGEGKSIQSLTEAAGFHYVYDAKSGEYAHPTGVIILTPEGKISRYILGIGYQGRDLKLGILEAAGRKITSPVDQFFLLCYRYNPESGRYDLAITNVLRISAAATALLIGGVILVFINKERNSANKKDKSEMDPGNRV